MVVCENLMLPADPSSAEAEKEHTAQREREKEREGEMGKVKAALCGTVYLRKERGI